MFQKKNKGITLVSLVITIILLLMLATISIQAFTGSGLFQKATYAKEQAKLAELEEQMNLAITEMIADKNGGGITIDDYIEHLKEKINITDRYEEDGKEIIVVDDKYVFEISDDDSYISVDPVGVKDKLPPILTLSSITNTTSSITVEVTTKRNEGGKIEYYIKAEDEDNYVLKYTQTDETNKYTYKELDQNKKYNIKIVAIAKNKQTAEVLVDRTTGNVTNLTKANVTFTFNPEGWTNGSVTVTAALKDMTSNYTLRITDSDPTLADKATAKGWADASTGITVSTNQDVYAVLVDNEGQIGDAATGSVEKIDTQIPVANITNTTTNSITFTGTDTAKTGESASGIAGYMIKESNEKPNATDTGWQTYDGTSKTVAGLTQGRTYYLFVKDNARNVSEVASEGTGKVTNLTKANVTFTFNPEGWTNGSVTVTAELKDMTSNYTLRITDSDPTLADKATAKGWANASTGITVSTNKDVYAVLVDNEGQIGDAVSGNVEKIDTQIPVANITNATTNSITFTGTDTAKEGESASGIAGYMIKESNEKPNATDTGWQTYDGTSKTVAGLTQGRTYYLFVKDNARNVSEVASEGTGNVTNLTKANVTFTFNPEGWTNGSVTVTAALKDMTSNYTLRITDSDPTLADKATAKGWADASTGITVSTNQDVYAVLVDNEGQIGDAATGSVEKIDTQIPVANITNTTTNSITFTGTDTAKEGESASGIAGYMIKESNEKPNATDTGWQTYDGTSKTVAGLTQGRTYYLFVKDNARNVSEVASEGTGNVTNLTKANVTFTYNPNGWTNGSVTVTAALKEGMTSEYTLKITDSDPTDADKQTALGWADASTGITVDSNTLIFAVLVDNEGQVGDAVSGNVEKIDTVAPTISTALSSTSTETNSVTLSVGVTDTDSGLGKIEWYYGETNNPTTLAGTTKVTDLNGTEEGPTTAQTKTATVTGLSAGTTYYFKVIAYDVAGKTTTSSVISATTKNPTAGDISYTPSDSSWNVDNVKSALDYLYNR